MAAAATAATVVSRDARWQLLIGAIPGVRTWTEIERDVDTWCGIRAGATSIEAIDAWKRTLATRYPGVSRFLDQHSNGARLRAYSANAMHALSLLGSDPRRAVDQLLDEWYQLGATDAAYSTQRMQAEHIAPLLAALTIKEFEMALTADNFDRAAMARFRADVDARGRLLAVQQRTRQLQQMQLRPRQS